MRAAPVAVLDANVLLPFQLRNLLLHLAVDGLFQPLWSEQIVEECVRNLRLRAPLIPNPQKELASRRDAETQRRRDTEKRIVSSFSLSASLRLCVRRVVSIAGCADCICGFGITPERYLESLQAHAGLPRTVRRLAGAGFAATTLA